MLAFQRTLLADARRNRAFYRALAARVKAGSCVLDLGAGSGVWAVAAARLGARKVVAVEREAVLRPVIEALARENGVLDRVRVVCGDARRVRLPRVFDVVVSETVGNEAFEEDVVAIMARARVRFLRRGGALVPEGLSLVAAPVAAPGPGRLVPALLPTASFASLAIHVPSPVDASRLRPLAAARPLLRADLRTARANEPLPLARVRFRVADGRAVGGIAVWVRMSLAPGVGLDTRRGTHWLPTVLPVEPLPAGPGRLEVEVDWNARRRRWTVVFEGRDGARHAASYSPLFAWGVVRPALRARRERSARR
jgi:protein arginine N-methyltransferase 1